MNKFREKFNQIATLENLCYLIVFCLPFYLIRFKFIFPTNLLEVLIIIFLLVSFLDKNNWGKIRIFYSKNKKYLVGFLIILISFLISAFINENTLKGLGIIKSWLVLPFLFSVMTFIILKKEKRKNVFITLYCSASALAFLGIIFVISGKLTFDGRLQLIFNSPNYLAMYLIPGIISGLFLIKKGFWRKYFPLSFIMVALFFTFSYLAWLSFFLVATGMIVGGLKKSFKAILVAFLLVGATFLIFAFKTEKMNDLLYLNERSSVFSRLTIWKSAGKTLKENYFLGIGPNNFQDKYLANQKYYPPYLEWAVPHPHSIYLSFWLGGGFIALITFLIMLFWWFKDFILQNKKETILGIVSLGIIVYFLLHGIADTTYFKNDLAVIFWLSFFSLL